MESTQMRMLKMICGKTVKDKVRSKLILNMTGIEPLKKFLRSQKLRWLGHIERMRKKSPVMAMKIIMKSEKKT